MRLVSFKKKRLYEKGKFEGLKGGKKQHSYKDCMLEILKKIIAFFEWSSRQKIIWEKSALCGSNIEENELFEEASKLNSKASHLPFFYLGLPLGGYPKQAVFWQPVIDRIQGKLEKWKR